jgi:hypothetical protein
MVWQFSSQELGSELGPNPNLIKCQEQGRQCGCEEQLQTQIPNGYLGLYQVGQSNVTNCISKVVLALFFTKEKVHYFGR